tara:strand:- start:599 stop:1822 length:1224 start_codon:yes stop_codon:yes gene_type:complete
MKPNYMEIGNNKGVSIKAWIKGVPVDQQAIEQLYNTAKLNMIYPHLAVMPDVHWGLGATIGSVIPTKNAIIPAAVGVDIGCGMMAVKTSLRAYDLPESMSEIRSNIEKAVPHGKTFKGRDKGAWQDPKKPQINAWKLLKNGFNEICANHPMISERVNHINHLGTLGSGNHFIEVCLDEDQFVWFMLHSGSRGVGNRIGRYFIEHAKKEMGRHIKNLPDVNLAYFREGNPGFDDYTEAVAWAQDFARINRELMMQQVIKAVSKSRGIPSFELIDQAINCHHNYVSYESHFNSKLWITRKGAVSAARGELGIIPGSMGDCSYIVRGKGNIDSFRSCSHGAGRILSRTEAKKRFSLEDHINDTTGVECRKDLSVIDETPRAYKPIKKVMQAQQDLVEIVHTLKQVICVKG